jgi:hypothetical protein
MAFEKMEGPELSPDKIEKYFGDNQHIVELREEFGDDWFQKLKSTDQVLGVKMADLWERLVVEKNTPTPADQQIYDDMISGLPGMEEVENDNLRGKFFGLIRNKATGIRYKGLTKIKKNEK